MARIDDYKQALELGLVDRLGGLDDAVKYAAAQANISYLADVLKQADSETQEALTDTGRALERDQNDQRILENIVIECAQELGDEEWQESTLNQQAWLTLRLCLWRHARVPATRTLPPRAAHRLHQ